MNKYKKLFTFSMITLGIFISFKHLNSSNSTISNKEFTELIINNTYTYNDNILKQALSTIDDKIDPIKSMNTEYTKYINNTEPIIKEETPYLIYLYNSHQTEEYKPSTYAEFSVNPTVIMNNYILEDIFNKNGYKTVVEENSIKEILNNNNWNYSSSYKASRTLLEQSIINYPSLKYFIDIHRDSLPHDKTTITIDNKDYAKVIFLIGLENPNYEENLEFTEKINNKMNELYPGLSKGIYQKGGPGVNGVYNQDFSKHTILIEIGGYENTTNEVLNTCLAFSKCFLEVIKDEDN